MGLYRPYALRLLPQMDVWSSGMLHHVTDVAEPYPNSPELLSSLELLKHSAIGTTGTLHLSLMS